MPTPMNAVDVGFLQDMIDHHEQAQGRQRLFQRQHAGGERRSGDQDLGVGIFQDVMENAAGEGRIDRHLDGAQQAEQMRV